MRWMSCVRGALGIFGFLLASSVFVAPAAVAQAGPDLTLTKSGTPDPVAAGSQITYTLSYSNDGDADATDVTLVDLLPPNTTFVSASNGGTPNGGLAIWSLGTIAANASGSVTLVVQVASRTADGTVLTNKATISSDQTEPISASTDTTVRATPELTLAVSGSPDPVTAGSQLTYTFTYTNISGTPTADGQIFSQLQPGTGLTFVSASNGGVYDPVRTAVTWTLGPIAAGATGSVTMVVTVDPQTPNGTMLQGAGVLTWNAMSVDALTTTTVQQSPPIEAIPTLDNVGLTALALLLCALGAWRLRRRRI